MENRKKRDIQKTSNEIKNEIQPINSVEIAALMKEKLVKIQEIIQKTILSIHLYKKSTIFSNSDSILCLSSLNEIYRKTVTLYDSVNSNIDQFVESLQNVVDKLSLILMNFGTTHIEDLLFIVFGSDFINRLNVNLGTNELIKSKYEIIKRFVHPIHYKIVNWKQTNKQGAIDRQNENISLCINKMVEDTISIELANNIECFDIDQTIKNYYIKVNGIRLVIHNEKAQKTIIIQCICDDISMDCITSLYINTRIKDIGENVPQSATFDQEIIKRILEALTLKEILVSGNNDIYKKNMVINSDVNMVTHNKIDIVIKKFIEMDMYTQRNLLINLLIYCKNDEVQYIAYLLYDLITINSSPGISGDSQEQIIMYDSFPLKIKIYFREAMKYTIKYSQEMMKKYDTNLISLEQKIYLLKVPENVKEKAMAKFKELKGKSDESGTKAKQYLEGLLKIPFGIYKQEPILLLIQNINENFIKVLDKMNPVIRFQQVTHYQEIAKKPKYSNIEIMQYTTTLINLINSNIIEMYITCNISDISLKTTIQVCNFINNLISSMNTYINTNNITTMPSSIQLIKGKTKTEKAQRAIEFLNSHTVSDIDKCKICDIVNPSNNSILEIYQDYKSIHDSIKNVETVMDNVVKELDDSIYGHTYAKNQILKIIGQWMNGEQTGYCFGFEGSPGIGKTSLAKNGLSNCLKDENGVSRPFAFIALGGSCNGSTLEGHSYTYVNSIWGRIVDILMETKCMNPIIYIDELDKVSKTEHGKEIIGILTHIIDSTQNDVFQDKYFSGIDIDLSKVLFIFSYNDPEQIDRILLDRIHRIKFSNLTVDDKMVIIQKYILPEIHTKMGIDSTSVKFADDVLEHIIEYYTMEPGIRKLKEILFDIYGEINIELLKCTDYKNTKLPIQITVDLLEKKYLKKYTPIHEKTIHQSSEIGIISGLWANALGKGGIIPIETVHFPSSNFLELKLTGLQGDVMKESMNVAKSLAWTLTPDKRKQELIQYFETTRNNGVHIHCPDGAVSKDGPSAGAAITSAIFSLLNNKRIKHTFAMTGEIDLRGNITAIGGLETKILGGIRAGVTTFIFPDANDKDFQEFKTKYLVNDKWANIEFIKVNHIKEVLELIYEK